VAESLFRLSFNYRFEAAHRFTLSCEDSCATPHGHTWRAKAVFEADATHLAEDDMVMEFSKLKSSWKRFIQERADHSFFHHYNDPILPTLREFIPKFRGLPFPGDPTTELIAALFYSKLRLMNEAIGVQGGAPVPRPAAVVIRETPTNTVTFRAGREASVALLKAIDAKYEGWWQVAEIEAAHCRPRSVTAPAHPNR
jgi:6-pyruvoyl-tetrahydropterin synthase